MYIYQVSKISDDKLHQIDVFKKRSTESRAFLNGSGNSAGLYGTRDEYHPTVETQLDQKFNLGSGAKKIFQDPIPIGAPDGSLGTVWLADAQIVNGKHIDSALDIGGVRTNHKLGYPYRTLSETALDASLAVTAAQAAEIPAVDNIEAKDPEYGFHQFIAIGNIGNSGKAVFNAAAGNIVTAVNVTQKRNFTGSYQVLMTLTLAGGANAVLSAKRNINAWAGGIIANGQKFEFTTEGGATGQEQKVGTDLGYHLGSKVIKASLQNLYHQGANRIDLYFIAERPFSTPDADTQLTGALVNEFSHFRLYTEGTKLLDEGAYANASLSQTQKPAFVDNFGADTRMKILTQDMSAGYIELMWQPPLGIFDYERSVQTCVHV